MKKANHLIKNCSLISVACLMLSCGTTSELSVAEESGDAIKLIPNVLNYSGTPAKKDDRNSLVFSDQGAWFGFGLSDSVGFETGFSGPFLLTQENGVWLSPSLVQFKIKEKETEKEARFKYSITDQASYSSHLAQSLQNDLFSVEQSLFFASAHSAIISTSLTNISGRELSLEPSFHGDLFTNDIVLSSITNGVRIQSVKSKAQGMIGFRSEELDTISINESAYSIGASNLILQPNETKTYLISVTFIFPEYDWKSENELLNAVSSEYELALNRRVLEKVEQQAHLKTKLDEKWKSPQYETLLAKTMLTLQNNWRTPAGELKYAGLFPSYHYEWFNGFWAWDSWKHAAALAHFNPELAKDQVKAMYDFQDSTGFIPDCVYRDTAIEHHNYRNTKAPLSAWAVWEIYSQDGDREFLKEMYSKIKLQHEWWYMYRDHDQDGLCEYGSTDGTIIAAKWESGMDNAVRFDESKILDNSNGGYSLDQESVDLNAYLYAEKRFLQLMSDELGGKGDVKMFEAAANELKSKIQANFYDKHTGWFYDTSIDGKRFIEVMGCEGWIPLWAECASQEQANAVRMNMMDETMFNTKVPLQTLSANHPKFKPKGGYWRGPNWLDQAYFGVMGLHNYGLHDDAYDLSFKLFNNADGLLKKGSSIRENYNPISGTGLESENFSWSAAHYLLLLLNE